MSPQQQPPSPSATIRLIHAALTIGVASMTAVLVVLRTTRPPVNTLPANVALIITVAVAVELAITAAMLRPRLSPRPSDQSPDEYWRAQTTPSLILWAVIEAGGLLGAVGYFLSGQLAPLAAVIVSLFLMVLFRPSAIEGN